MSVVALNTRSDVVPQPPQNWLRAYYKRHSFSLKIGALMVLLLIAVGWQWVVVSVPAGYVAVKYYRFAGGTNASETYGEGSHLKLPWDKSAIYPVRLQQEQRNFDMLTRDGLMVTVSIACRFRLNAPAIGWLHRNIGPEYMETLIAPSLGSYARLVISQHTTEELYSRSRAAIQDEIKRIVTADLAQGTKLPDASGRSAVLVDDVLILGVRFPPAVQAAIDRKMEQYQLREEYAYRIQREELESERKEIEARGIAQFQNIVGAGISDNYLRWKSIDATMALAQSPNSKVVVVGNGKDSMPLFLNGDDGSSQPVPSPPHPAQVRAETPLTGLAATPPPPPEAAPASEEKAVSWSRWLIGRIGSFLTVPSKTAPESTVSAADGMESATTP